MFKPIVIIILLANSLFVATADAGNPAARIGDSMNSGGVILPPGAPTVMIGGKPAARLGDQTSDPRVFPPPNIFSPPIICTGGPIINGSATVLIGGLPAARLGDLASSGPCPPHTIIQGAPTVLIGG